MAGPRLPSCNGDIGPLWLRPLLEASYFVPCKIHGDSNKSECNLYYLDCMGAALCSYCLAHHRDHHIVQIRRSSYHNVIRVAVVEKRGSGKKKNEGGVQQLTCVMKFGDSSVASADRMREAAVH